MESLISRNIEPILINKNYVFNDFREYEKKAKKYIANKLDDKMVQDIFESILLFKHTNITPHIDKTTNLRKVIELLRSANL